MTTLMLLLLLMAPAWAADVSGLDWTQRQGAPLPYDAPLVDASGAATTLGRVAGGLPLVLAPGYFRCPNLCGVVREDLFTALEASGLQAGRDYALALVTIDVRESPADAARTLEGIRDRFPGLEVHALAGPAASLAALSGAVGFNSRFDPVSREFLHPAGVVLVTPGALVSGYVLGVGYEPAALADAIGVARAGGSAPAEPVHLFCFSYDPVSGRFSATVLEAVRLAGVLTVLAVGSFIVGMARRA